MITYSKSMITKMNPRMMDFITNDFNNYQNMMISEDDKYFLINLLSRKSPIKLKKVLKSLENNRIILYFNLENRIPSCIIPVRSGSNEISVIANLAELTNYKYNTIDKLSNINDLTHLLINAEVQANIYNKPTIIKFDKDIEKIAILFYTDIFNRIFDTLYNLSAESYEIKKAVKIITIAYVNNIILEKNIININDVLNRYDSDIKLSSYDKSLVNNILNNVSTNIISNIEDYIEAINEVLELRKEIKITEVIKSYLLTFVYNMFSFDMVQNLIGHLAGCYYTGSFKYKCSTYKTLINNKDLKIINKHIKKLTDYYSI